MPSLFRRIEAQVVDSFFCDKITVWISFQPNNRVRVVFVLTVLAHHEFCTYFESTNGRVHTLPLPSFFLKIKTHPTAAGMRHK